jgi:uncharacterized membrane protein YoaK (UPF0700 family)
MTRTRWARVFAFASMLQLGAFVGALGGQHALNAIVWAVVFFGVSVGLTPTTGGQR